MRKQILLILSLFFSLFVTAQQNLSGSRQTSYYTYIYKISNKEALALFQSGMENVGEKHLHSLVDSFRTYEDDEPVLQPGNYLWMYAAGSRLNTTLRSVGDVSIKLVNNDRDLVVAVHTKEGQLIEDAAVYINNRKIPFNKNTKSFRLNKRKRTGLIKVYHKEVLHQFPLEKKPRVPLLKKVWRKVGYGFPLKYVVRPIRKLIRPGYNYRYHNYFNEQAKTEKEYRGFMVFNKPMYKPGDTVKLKAYILSKSGKPVNRPLLVRLTGQDFITDSIIATIHPYRAGGYDYQFVLTDSLDIDLDDNYMITLEEPSSRKYDLDEYDGNLDEDEYALKRKILMRGKFRYEEYELQTTTFIARSDKEEHHRGNPVAIYLKAVDENDMAIMDGRVEILVKPILNSSPQFHAPKVFLPDTLWHHTQPLETIGETKIVLPDSIYPAATFSYEIQCIFLNSNNEYKTQTLRNTFSNNRYSLFFDQRKDSLYIAQLQPDKPVSREAMLYAFNENDDTLYQKTVQLPATIPINPFATYYEVETEEVNDEFYLSQKKGMVNALAFRTKDSVIVRVNNPGKLFFWYTVFAGNKPIHRGYGDTLLYAAKTHTAKNYFIALQYVYANKIYKENYTIPYRDKLLTIQVNQPEFVYPGKTSTIDISVADANGKPVAGADVTAYAFTKKFTRAKEPFVPYLGKTWPGRKRFLNFYQAEEKEAEGNIKLTWERWSHEIGLDSIEYFRFLHTDSIYVNTELAKDSITQIAPFVVINGRLQPVHQVYIDEKPVFFSQAQHLQRYSFSVMPGKHSLRLRTHNQLIRLDSIWAERGMKTFICINGDTAINKKIRAENMPVILTAYEQNLWSKYMLLLENNFGEQLAYISRPGLVYLVNTPGRTYSSPYSILTGPLPNYHTELVVKNKFSQLFEPEGNYFYNITKGLIKQKQLPFRKYAFNPTLSYSVPTYNFNDYVLTVNEVDSMWQYYLDHRSANEELFTNLRLNKDNNGKLHIGVDKIKEGEHAFVKNILLFRYDDTDFARMYKGTSRDLGYVQPGTYRLFLLLKDDHYFIKDSIHIKKDGINYYATGTIITRQRDSMSMRIADIINKREKINRYDIQVQDMDAIKETFNEKFQDASTFTNPITGSVIDAKTNLPLPGVVVTIKGTKAGVVTDAHGFFRLNVPPQGTLAISYIGYETVERRLTGGYDYAIQLHEATAALGEVVVVGYGTARKMRATGALSIMHMDGVLMGAVPGITIRGISSSPSASIPLVIVDGLPYTGRLEDLDQSLIAEVKSLDAATATAIWGSRASGGAIVIITKKGSSTAVNENLPPVPGNSLRKDFRDDAFWQPRLLTNASGKVSFTVTFPDDITNWRTFFIAMGAHKQTGFKESSIRSVKLLSGNLSVPQFAIEGDSINITGKTLNYGMDSIAVKRAFLVDDKMVTDQTIRLRNSHIDTFSVTAPPKDSLQLTYTVQKEDDYFDGEERTIPVFKRGSLETNGFFAALDKDTSFTVAAFAATGEIKLYAESSVLPVLLDEIEKLCHYEYLCNEQLASKLKALLLKKKVYSYLQKDFKEGRNINDLIGKLNNAKSKGGLWGWWSNNDPMPWISLHVTEALLLAEKEGYRVNLNKQLVKDYIIYSLESYKGTGGITALRLLQLLDSKADFKKYIDTLEARKNYLSLYETLRLQELKQELGLRTGLDTLLPRQSHTMFGNAYWGEDGNYHLFDNAIQNTVLMYRLLKKAGGHETTLRKTRNYFLEKRKNGQWRNTYESSLILETILPDLLLNDSLQAPVSITINGGVAVQSFPFETTLQAGEPVLVTKQGSLPVYFTAYQQRWNPEPKAVAGDFTVISSFEKNGHVVPALKAGDPVTMKIKVIVKADAEYVMVEAPVPAGCSYKDKSQSYFNNEVHREYFKNKVSIFCSSLKKGEYLFTVSLLPRYTGSYHLNPAKAAMMYYPVFYGREAMKKVSIR